MVSDLDINNYSRYRYVAHYIMIMKYLIKFIHAFPNSTISPLGESGRNLFDEWAGFLGAKLPSERKLLYILYFLTHREQD